MLHDVACSLLGQCCKKKRRRAVGSDVAAHILPSSAASCVSYSATLAKLLFRSKDSL